MSRAWGLPAMPLMERRRPWRERSRSLPDPRDPAALVTDWSGVLARALQGGESGPVLGVVLADRRPSERTGGPRPRGRPAGGAGHSDLSRADRLDDPAQGRGDRRGEGPRERAQGRYRHASRSS